MTEIMPVPRNLSFTVLPAEGLRPALFLNTGKGRNTMSEKQCICGHEMESGGFFSGLFGGRDDDKPRKNQPPEF